MLMNEHDDACVDAMLMVNMQANTRSVTPLISNMPVRDDKLFKKVKGLDLGV